MPKFTIVRTVKVLEIYEAEFEAETRGDALDSFWDADLGVPYRKVLDSDTEVTEVEE